VYGLASRLVNTSEQICGALAPGSDLEVDDAIDGRRESQEVFLTNVCGLTATVGT
jgi:hypothetical protein